MNWTAYLPHALRLFFETWSFLVVLVLVLTYFAAVALWLGRRIIRANAHARIHS
jgi:hypothetical protein